MHYAIQKKTYYPGGLLHSSRVHLKIQNYFKKSSAKINTRQTARTQRQRSNT